MTSPAGRAPRRLPMLFQSEAAECGLACLAMAASYHGHELDLSAIRHRFRVSLKGTTLKDLTVFARRLGMTTRALRLEPAGLSKLALPAILHFDMNHFVVLKAVKGGRIVIHDPARGVCTLSPRQVSARFTGIAMELIPAAGFERRRERSELSFVQLVGAVPGSGGALAKALVLSAGLQILILAAPLYVQLALDRGVS
ncbi:MAG: cysteine peptidase family C39 domain-containing protein, partial [Caulobacteraceae bacterium]